MALIRIDHQPTRRQLAVFGSLWLLFLGGWSLILGLRHGWTPLPIGLGAAAVAAPLIGLMHTEPLRWLYLATSYAAFPIGWVVSHMILATIYYLVMTPIGLIMRLVGYDPMTRQLDREAVTYWVAREPAKDRQRYFKQF